MIELVRILNKYSECSNSMQKVVIICGKKTFWINFDQIKEKFNLLIEKEREKEMDFKESNQHIVSSATKFKDIEVIEEE